MFTASELLNESCSSTFFTPCFQHTHIPVRNETLAFSDDYNQIRTTYFSLSKYSHVLKRSLVLLRQCFIFFSSKELDAEGS